MNQETQIPMINLDLATYTKKKEAGIITPVKVGNTYAIAIRRWDATTGKEIDPTITAISIKQLIAQKTQLTESIVALETFIADLESL